MFPANCWIYTTKILIRCNLWSGQVTVYILITTSLYCLLPVLCCFDTHFCPSVAKFNTANCLKEMSIVVCVSICFCYPDILRKVKCSSLADCMLGGLESIKNEEEDKIILKSSIKWCLSQIFVCGTPCAFFGLFSRLYHIPYCFLNIFANFFYLSQVLITYTISFFVLFSFTFFPDIPNSVFCAKLKMHIYIIVCVCVCLIVSVSKKQGNRPFILEWRSNRLRRGFTSVQVRQSWAKTGLERGANWSHWYTSCASTN